MRTEGNKATVFVVDDEPIITSTLTAILNMSGFETTGFTDPLAALEAVNTKHPDILISDVMMPQLNGLELASRFQELCPECKIILFSGQVATASLLERALEKGHHFQVLAKPVHPKDLLAAIRSRPSAGPDSRLNPNGELV
jgi:CheY-like chemotaxis protein